MFNRIKAITKKEALHLLRDKRLLIVIFFFPAFLLGIFGYAVNFDVRHIKLAVYDLDKSDISRNFTSVLTSSEYFDIVKYVKNDNEIKEVLDDKLAQVTIIIPEDFSDNIYTNKEEPKLQYLIDGVDGNTAAIIKNYITGAVQYYNKIIQKDLYSKKGVKPFTPLQLETLFWYNPTLESTKFLLPGLIGMILIITAVITVSLSFVREKERGTIEQINVSSINILELIIGKSLPYLIVALINAALILIAGYILFGIAVKGDYFLLLISTIIFLAASVSLGILISVIADSQQVAFSVATFATLLPSVILSGFIFPIESMPPIIQVITNITPVKFYIKILRSIMLKGVGLEAFWDQLIYLLLFMIFFITLAALLNTKKSKSA